MTHSNEKAIGTPFASDSAFKDYDSSYIVSKENGLMKAAKLFLNENNAGNSRVLNVGSGPADVVTPFIDYFYPLCKEIVLCEINPLFCQQYKECEWYKKDESGMKKIYIGKGGGIEDIFKNSENKYNNNSFDLIWCSHVFYYFELKDISKIICKFNDLLTCNKYQMGRAVIIISDDNKSQFIQKILKKISPQYGLSKFIENSIKKCGLYDQCIEIPQTTYHFLKKQEIIDMFVMFVNLGIFKSNDYNEYIGYSGKDGAMSESQLIEMAKKVVLNALPSVIAATNDESDNYVWQEEEISFILKKGNGLSNL